MSRHISDYVTHHPKHASSGEIQQKAGGLGPRTSGNRRELQISGSGSPFQTILSRIRAGIKMDRRAGVRGRRRNRPGRHAAPDRCAGVSGRDRSRPGRHAAPDRSAGVRGRRRNRSGRHAASDRCAGVSGRGRSRPGRHAAPDRSGPSRAARRPRSGPAR